MQIAISCDDDCPLISKYLICN